LSRAAVSFVDIVDVVIHETSLFKREDVFGALQVWTSRAGIDVRGGCNERAPCDAVARAG
jgi:hypothetical protein